MHRYYRVDIGTLIEFKVTISAIIMAKVRKVEPLKLNIFAYISKL